MNLNLGLENLNGTVSASVVPFTPASAVEMQNASEAITNLMVSLENYYDAARNAMLVRRAVKKYGKTQSIVALIGQEGLAAAQTFSMEGFWQKTKDFLWKIWSKIKEWWGRFWGMFFSVEDKLRNFASGLSGKTLVSDCEFDAAELGAAGDSKTSTIYGRAKVVSDAITTLKTAAQSSQTNDQNVAHIKSLIAQMPDENGATVSEGGFATKHYVYKKAPEIASVADSLAKNVFAAHRNSKKEIDRYTDDFLKKIKDIKVTVGNSSGNAWGRGATSGRLNDSATAEESEEATQIIKNAAKVNNKLVSSTLKAATTFAVKLMANTRVKNA